MVQKEGFVSIQVGKNGLSEGLIDAIRNAFKTHKSVRLSVLRSLSRERSEVKVLADEINRRLGPSHTKRILGYTIIIKKWRKAQKK